MIRCNEPAFTVKRDVENQSFTIPYLPTKTWLVTCIDNGQSIHIGQGLKCAFCLPHPNKNKRLAYVVSSPNFSQAQCGAGFGGDGLTWGINEMVLSISKLSLNSARVGCCSLQMVFESMNTLT